MQRVIRNNTGEVIGWTEIEHPRGLHRIQWKTATGANMGEGFVCEPVGDWSIEEQRAHFSKDPLKGYTLSELRKHEYETTEV